MNGSVCKRCRKPNRSGEYCSTCGTIIRERRRARERIAYYFDMGMDVPNGHPTGHANERKQTQQDEFEIALSKQCMAEGREFATDEEWDVFVEQQMSVISERKPS